MKVDILSSRLGDECGLYLPFAATPILSAHSLSRYINMYSFICTYPPDSACSRAQHDYMLRVIRLVMINSNIPPSSLE